MISESKDLTTITVSTLFERLREFELELGRLKDEEVDKKKKGLALKMSTSHHVASDEDPTENSDNKNMNLLVENFSKFMKKKGRDN